MDKKTRIIIVALVGVLLFALIANLHRSSTPIEQRLVSKNDSTRNRAVQDLERMSEEERVRVAEIVANRQPSLPDARQRKFGLYAMRKAGAASSRNVVNAMLAALSDKDKKVVEEATVGLREAGDVVIPEMIRALTNGKIRTAAISILSAQGPNVIPELSGALNSDNALSQRGATAVVMNFNRPETVEAASVLVPKLAANLKSDDEILALNSAFALHRVAPKDRRPVPVFLRQIQKPNWLKWDVRGFASLDALTEIGAADETLPVLSRALLKAPDSFTKQRSQRATIAAAMEQIKPRTSTTSERVADLKSGDPALRYRAAFVIGSTQPVSESAVVPLIAALDDADIHVAARAFHALTRFGLEKTQRHAATAYPKYLKTYSRINGERVKGFPEMAAGPIGNLGQGILQPMFSMLKTGEMRLDAAIKILEYVRADSVSFLRASLNDPNPNVRLAAAITLVRLSPATDGLRAILEGEQSRPEPVKTSIQKALKRLTN